MRLCAFKRNSCTFCISFSRNCLTPSQRRDALSNSPELTNSIASPSPQSRSHYARCSTASRARRPGFKERKKRGLIVSSSASSGEMDSESSKLSWWRGARVPLAACQCYPGGLPHPVSPPTKLLTTEGFTLNSHKGYYCTRDSLDAHT